ncbi:MAG: Choline-sulfatase [Verrucomicrobiales bacterium]|nr:Choline-sulfatase [Verrucomicrobiales bacterium]
MLTALSTFAAEKKLNVLFIAIDDLRPELGCYGVKGIKSPNIDALAKRGLLFSRAYCQQAVCSPSRTSLLTGRRPDTTRIYNLEDHFRDTIPDVVTLPQHFKNNGYFCQSFGKIYHGGLDDPKSWSVPGFLGALDNVLMADGSRRTIADPDDLTEGKFPFIFAANKEASGPNGKQKPNGKGQKGRPPWSAPDVEDNELSDGQMAEKAIEVMQNVKDKPFFLAVGFHKPHLSFDAPKKYYDLYKLEDMKLASNPFPPKDVFPPAMIDWKELRNYTGMPQEGPVSDQQARELIRGYYAATSYMDAQLGKVLAALDKLGLRDNTIIILWGDHGWQLGEHGMWCKHTNYETSTHSVLMISTPTQKKRGAKTDALVEFVDIYPSLCELAGLPLTDGLEGKSFVPLLSNPKKSWKSAAFSQYPRGPLMGYAMRTDRYRYVEWVTKEKVVKGRELYDHKNDADENVNVANLPANKALIEKLSQQLVAGWRAAGP